MEYKYDDDEEMDRRACAATEAAIKKAKVLGVPIAKWDPEKKKAYFEYPDGHREDVE